MTPNKQKPSEEKMTPDEWLKTDEFKHLAILDPDGWNRQAEDWNKEWSTPLTKDEMWGKTMLSTICVNL